MYWLCVFTDCLVGQQMWPVHFTRGWQLSETVLVGAVVAPEIQHPGWWHQCSSRRTAQCRRHTAQCRRHRRQQSGHCPGQRRLRTGHRLVSGRGVAGDRAGLLRPLSREGAALVCVRRHGGGFPLDPEHHVCHQQPGGLTMWRQVEVSVAGGVLGVQDAFLLDSALRLQPDEAACAGPLCGPGTGGSGVLQGGPELPEAGGGQRLGPHHPFFHQSAGILPSAALQSTSAEGGHGGWAEAGAGWGGCPAGWEVAGEWELGHHQFLWGKTVLIGWPSCLVSTRLLYLRSSCQFASWLSAALFIIIIKKKKIGSMTPLFHVCLWYLLTAAISKKCVEDRGWVWEHVKVMECSFLCHLHMDSVFCELIHVELADFNFSYI